MSLTGSACLAIWNDVDPVREAEYNLWHTSEHVPERCGVSGILEGRRYVAAGTERHRYLTLYDLRDLEVLASAAYRDLIETPTPWSAAMRPAFRNFLREPCAVLATLGTGIGGAAASIRFAVRREAAPIAVDGARRLLTRLGENTAFCALTLAAVAPDEPHPLALGAAAEPLSAGPRYLLLAEATTRSALAQVQAAVGPILARELAATEVEARAYDLAFLARYPGSGLRATAAGGTGWEASCAS